MMISGSDPVAAAADNEENERRQQAERAKIEAAFRAFEEAARNLSRELIADIKAGTVSEDDAKSPVVQVARQAWWNYEKLTGGAFETPRESISLPNADRVAKATRFPYMH